MSAPIPIVPFYSEHSARGHAYSALSAKQHLKVDVAVIGAGFTGLTAATELCLAGKSVAVLDMTEIGGGESNLSTAQMTELLDTRYHELVSKFGKTGAALAARASRDSIDWAERHAASRKECRFQRLPAFLFSEKREDEQELDRECLAAIQSGVHAQRVTTLPPQLKAISAMCVDNQAQIDPRQYLHGLARRLVEKAARIFEHTRIASIEDGTPCTITTTNGAVVKAGDCIVATHTPICNMLFLHTKLAAYRTYVVAARFPEGGFPEGLYYDMNDPYHYIRTDTDKSGNLVLIVGGEDHKTGDDEDPEPRYRRLQQYVSERFGLRDFDFHWSGQVLKPIDGLPYIGRNSASEHLYVGTGYNGNGTTFGTLAGMIITDLILGRSNPYSELFEARRISPIAGAKDFIVENSDALAHFIGDRLKSPAKSLDDVPAGEGRIVELDGTRAAVYRGEDGEMHAVSAVCTHVGCIVHWNNSEKTWDCPCHGARYSPTGKVINGPATKDLRALPVPHLAEKR
jgi:glycine/D-amino acid oxidase-like deaminating enzyme/nitrite reductase/ring-hydroxylating ferredoxin subunit